MAFTVPVDATIRSVKDGNLANNEMTFTINGQTYTMSEGDVVQRAREMAETDPAAVAANPILSDLARGVGVRAAFTDPKDKRRWGYFALPVLHDDRLVGKLDATVDRKAGFLVVNAIHQDVPFNRAIAAAVRHEIEDLATWLDVDVASLRDR